MVELTQGCAARLDYLFPAEADRVEVRRLLTVECADALPLYMGLPAGKAGHPSDYDRVRFAVLKLAAGDMERLRWAINMTKVDWRDTLVAAGFGHEVRAHERWLAELDEN